MSSNNKRLELELDNKKFCEQLLVNGLDTHGVNVRFREATTTKTTVSLMEVPLGYPLDEIEEEMSGYGDLARLYRIKETVRGRIIPI